MCDIISAMVDEDFIDIVTGDETQYEPVEDKAAEERSFAGSYPSVQSGYPCSRM